MSKTYPYIFVLWADKFEETAATIFVTELRKAGLRVKVVGLSRQRTPGSCGLALLPDYTLEEALPLAGQTSCLVIPSSLRIAKRLKNDPRLGDFIWGARANRARVIIGPLNDTDSDDLGLYSLSVDDVTVYPGCENLFEFVRDIAPSLANPN